MSPIEARESALSIAEAAQDHKALNLRILKVSPLIDYADYFILISASSTRHSKALADAIAEAAGVTAQPEGYALGDWIVVDAGEVVAHIFHEPVRQYYNFDKLWAHVPVVEMAALTKTGSKSSAHPSGP